MTTEQPDCRVPANQAQPKRSRMMQAPRSAFDTRRGPVASDHRSCAILPDLPPLGACLEDGRRIEVLVRRRNGPPGFDDTEYNLRGSCPYYSRYTLFSRASLSRPSYVLEHSPCSREIDQWFDVTLEHPLSLAHRSHSLENTAPSISVDSGRLRRNGTSAGWTAPAEKPRILHSMRPRVLPRYDSGACGGLTGGHRCLRRAGGSIGEAPIRWTRSRRTMAILRYA